jgi:hypothetical protein
LLAYSFQYKNNIEYFIREVKTGFRPQYLWRNVASFDVTPFAEPGVFPVCGDEKFCMYEAAAYGQASRFNRMTGSSLPSMSLGNIILQSIV